MIDLDRIEAELDEHRPWVELHKDIFLAMVAAIRAAQRAEEAWASGTSNHVAFPELTEALAPFTDSESVPS